MDAEIEKTQNIIKMALMFISDGVKFFQCVKKRDEHRKSKNSIRGKIVERNKRHGIKTRLEKRIELNLKKL